MSGPPPQPMGPSWLGLVWAALPMAGCMAVLAWRRLGQVRAMAIATVRLVVQLVLLGFVLQAIFEARHPGVVALVALAMLAASAQAVNSRSRRRSWTMGAETFLAIGLGALAVMVVGTRLALPVQPWYDPRVVVPLLGMVLGNSLTGVALGAERLDSELRAERDRVELRLALGATAGQAARPALRSAVGAALTPTINSMMIAGIVAVPGMMTGQLLAGAPVGDALRYQIMIYFLIAATVALSTFVLLALRLRHYFTAAHQLRPEALGL